MRRLYFSVVALLCAAVLAGCMTIKNDVDYTVTDQQPVDVQIANVVQTKNLGLWCMCVPVTITNTKGVTVAIKNNSENPVSINWNKSSIAWKDENSPCITENSKFIQAGTNTIPNTTVAAGKSAKVTVYPANNVEWDGDDWELNDMNLKAGDTITVVAFVENENPVTAEYTVERKDGFHFLW